MEVQMVLSNEKYICYDERHFHATCDRMLGICLRLDHFGSVLLSHVPQF